MSELKIARFLSRPSLLGLGILLVGSACLEPSVARGDPGEERIAQLFNAIVWQDGPCQAKLGEVAELDVPDGYRFTGAAGARNWAEANGNPPSSQAYGILTPNDYGWSITFAYSADGYVSDAERDQLDASALLASIRQGTEQSNLYRRQHGFGELHVVGWEQSPEYDSYSHNLVWAIRGRSDHGEVVNYNTRLLGRGGVMSANLVISPEQFGSTLPTVKGLLTGFRYRSGQKYEEWRSGDRVAEYGLGALILGGGAAVAAKTGLLAKLGAFIAKAWKPLALAAAALFAWAKRSLFLADRPSSS